MNKDATNRPTLVSGPAALPQSHACTAAARKYTPTNAVVSACRIYNQGAFINNAPL